MAFRKPSQRPVKPTEEPPGLDEFANAASNVHLLASSQPQVASGTVPVSAPAVVQRTAPQPAAPPLSPQDLNPKAKPTFGRNVRFNEFTRSVLTILGERDDRSLQYYVNQLFIPAVLELAKKEGLYRDESEPSE